MASRAFSRVIFSFTRRCKSDVARKTCSLGAAAGFKASSAASTSSFLARASAAIGTSRTSLATICTASRSPREEIGKPASITSTCSAASCLAMRSFSLVFMGKPGDCSPSRSVVSKMRTVSIMGPPAYRVSQSPSNARARPPVQFIFVLLLIILPYTSLPETSLGACFSLLRSSGLYQEAPRVANGPLPRKIGLPGGRVDLGELQVFLTVAKEGSFSRAAERLYRTQPAISLAIRKLEDSLGQPLFVRGARPVRLTDAGTLLRDYADRLINLRDEVKEGLSELEALTRRELSLGVNS